MRAISFRNDILPGTIVFSIFLMLIGICIGDASEILPGLWKIVTMQDLLITDYIDIAGPAAAFVNAGLVTIISICLIWLAKDPFNGFTIVEMGLMAGFSLFGKNLFNIWPIILGTWLYARYQREPFSKYASVALLSTSLAPLVSYMALGSVHASIPLGVLTGVAELGVAPHNIAVISGIGCSSRLPYYVNTYGFHTIHGRAAAVATGAKVANPDLTIWQISGDGDGLAIGGNHFIHALRRNIDLNMILLNNRIYGLTKGQYSPTSERGLVTKSSPYGTVEDPFHPAELAFGARGHFFARCIAVDGAASVEVLKAAANHKGASVVEVLQNCVIFNDGTHASVATKEGRAKNAIYLEHGKPMLFGENKEFGLMQEGFGLKVVKLGENGITEKDILIHDAHCQDNTLQLKLALMEGPDFPIALGVIRDVDAPTYNDAVIGQIEEIKGKKKYHNFQELLMTNDTWEVK